MPNTIQEHDWNFCEISGSHGGKHEDDSFLGYSAM
jgi:hypothetical protein